MAPEQARGEAVDCRADLFSLGCVLYGLSTSQLPFKGMDVLSTLTALATHNPVPPKALSGHVSAASSELIMDLLQKDPWLRPASSQGVLERIIALPGNGTTHAPARVGGRDVGARPTDDALELPGRKCSV